MQYVRGDVSIMDPATIRIAGDGWPVGNSLSHPEGLIYSGGYDAELNTVFLAGVMGHPRGVSLGGGDPSKACVSGLRVLQLPSGEVYWADDSMSLPRGLSDNERSAVQTGLESLFVENAVRHVAKLEDIPKTA